MFLRKAGFSNFAKNNKKQTKNEQKQEHSSKHTHKKEVNWGCAEVAKVYEKEEVQKPMTHYVIRENSTV